MVLLFLAILTPERLSLQSVDESAALTADPMNLDPSLLPQVLVWILASAWVGWFFSKNRMRLPSTLKQSPTRVYMLFVTISLFSTFYSVSPYYTLFFAAKLLITVLLIASLAQSALRPESVQRLLIRVFTIQWFVIAFLYLWQPEVVGTGSPSIGYRLTGGLLFGDYGFSALIAGLGFLSNTLLPSRSSGVVRLANFALYGLSFYFVLLSKTRSTLAAAIVVFLIMTLLHPRVNVRLGGLIAAWAGLGAVFLFRLDQHVVDFVLRGQSVDVLLGLTGRGQAFDYYIEVWKESPFFGYGFQAGNRLFGVDFMNATGLGIASAHDALSKVLVDVGILGLTALGTAILGTWSRLFQLAKESKATLIYRIEVQQLLCLMSVLMALSLVSGSLADVSFPFVVVMISSQSLASRIKVRTMPTEVRGSQFSV